MSVFSRTSRTCLEWSNRNIGDANFIPSNRNVQCDGRQAWIVQGQIAASVVLPGARQSQHFLDDAKREGYNDGREARCLVNELIVEADVVLRANRGVEDLGKYASGINTQELSRAAISVVVTNLGDAPSSASQ